MKIGCKLFILALTVPLFLGILNFKAQAQVTTKKLGVAGIFPFPAIMIRMVELILQYGGQVMVLGM